MCTLCIHMTMWLNLKPESHFSNEGKQMNESDRSMKFLLIEDMQLRIPNSFKSN